MGEMTLRNLVEKWAPHHLDVGGDHGCLGTPAYVSADDNHGRWDYISKAITRPTLVEAVVAMDEFLTQVTRRAV